jgi:hypothetical protein
MTRALTSGVQTAVAADVVRPVTLVKMAFDSGTVHYSGADRAITYSGDSYIGIGNFAGFSVVEEGVDLQTYSVTISISGVPTSLLSISLSEDYQNRFVTLYQGFLNDSYALIADPVEIFKGRVNQMNIEAGETATISLSVESRLVDWERPRIRRYNNADQQVAFSGDKGFEFVPQMVEKELIWGRV